MDIQGFIQEFLMLERLDFFAFVFAQLIGWIPTLP
jgi:hypothetical protein